MRELYACCVTHYVGCKSGTVNTGIRICSTVFVTVSYKLKCICNNLGRRHLQHRRTPPLLPPPFPIIRGPPPSPCSGSPPPLRRAIFIHSSSTSSRICIGFTGFSLSDDFCFCIRLPVQRSYPYRPPEPASWLLVWYFRRRVCIIRSRAIDASPASHTKAEIRPRILKSSYLSFEILLS